MTYKAKLLLASLILIFANMQALAEEPPFFRAEPQYPNVFIIFDNSDSMQDVPYLTTTGVSVRPSGRQWRQNVELNSDKKIVLDTSGNPKWQNVTWPDSLPDIDENANPTRLADGGNHPSSKLYQAKMALNVILNNITDVNLGFATYLSQRDPKVVALYYRIVPATSGTTTPIRWEVLERATSPSTSNPTIYSSNADSFIFCGNTYTGKSVGQTIDVPRTCAQSSPPSPTACSLRNETITYTITEAAVPEYRDGSIYRYRWKLTAPYYQYRIATIEDATDSYDPTVIADDDWKTSYPATGGPNNLPPPLAGGAVLRVVQAVTSGESVLSTQAQAPPSTTPPPG